MIKNKESCKKAILHNASAFAENDEALDDLISAIQDYVQYMNGYRPIILAEEPCCMGGTRGFGCC